jgi:hypothetical protein
MHAGSNSKFETILLSVADLVYARLSARMRGGVGASGCGESDA